MAVQLEIILIAGVVALGLIVLGKAIMTGFTSPAVSSPGRANQRIASAASRRGLLGFRYSAAKVRHGVNMPRGPRGEKRRKTDRSINAPQYHVSSKPRVLSNAMRTKSVFEVKLREGEAGK